MLDNRSAQPAEYLPKPSLFIAGDGALAVSLSSGTDRSSSSQLEVVEPDSSSSVDNVGLRSSPKCFYNENIYVKLHNSRSFAK